ncbi:hypothetical protein J2S34_001865 [Nitrobacter winogradskyi]|uniref:Uncharacterized protein n=2 Tax=Nitrobacter winogradskyi TaxID=913 RepID=A0A4Y3WD56_NITWI|nr:hypothetical protein [Nitrobacter winogradskyi]MCP1999417.1 hypothetical protein [Nitrobacter winogradskyi]GEC16081.1 hypothetical protein NWI01_19730 [Nitrobacter winogradskyi]
MLIVEQYGEAPTDVRVIRCRVEYLFLDIRRQFWPELQNRTAKQLFKITHSYRPYDRGCATDSTRVDIPESRLTAWNQTRRLSFV